MAECIALRVSLDENLAGLSHWLRAQGIAHRITEQSGQQVVWVASEASAEVVREAYQQGLREVPGQLVKVAKRSPLVSIAARLISVPVTALAIIFSCIGAALVSFGDVAWLQLLSFQPFELLHRQPVFESLDEAMSRGEYWRLFTPMILHFGTLHLVFNCLWLWELGGAVERRQGTGRLLMLVLVLGATSNYCQYVYHVDVLFGGMSGVIYGLVGYCWIWQKLVPAESLNVSDALFWILVGFMLVMMTGVFSILGFGDIANAAHTSGLLAGLFIGAVFGWQRRRRYQ